MRTKNIDILKAICAFLVVCIHIPFPGILGAYFTALTRIAVPIFFMITGYFYADIVLQKRQNKQLRKIIKLCILSSLIYIAWDVLLTVFKKKNLFDLLSELFTTKNCLNLLLLNESPWAGHLWYLNALLYVLVVVFVVDKLHCRKILYWGSPFLLIGNLLLGEYSLLLFRHEFPNIIARNFLFIGIPYFCIGCMIRDLPIKKVADNNQKKWLILLMLFFSITTILERFFLEKVNMNAARDHYISTTFLAITVFLFALSTERRATSKATGTLLIIGKNYATWIYILHPIFILVISTLAQKIGLYNVYMYIAPMVVYIGTLLFLSILTRIKNI